MQKEDYAFINDPTLVTDPSPSIISEKPLKLLFSKSKVYVHPSANSQTFIPGYISIVEKQIPENLLLISWTPEILIPSEDLEAYVQVDSHPEENEQVSTIMVHSAGFEHHSKYALSTPLQDIHSIVVRPPSFTKWYGSIIFNFKNGHSSTPFWFHDDESNSTVLQKNTQGGKWSCDEQRQQTRWGGDEFMERLCSLVPIEISEKDTTLYYIRKGKNSSTSKPQAYEMTQMDPLIASLKEMKWGLFEKLSRVTKFSRNTAASILQQSQVSNSVLSRYQDNDNVRQTMDDYDSARIFLAKWAAGLAAQSSQNLSEEHRYRHVGLWGHHGEWEQEDTALGSFEILNSENDMSIPTHTRTKPITLDHWKSFFDHTGKLSVGEPFVLESIFRGGLDPTIRKEAWLFLLGVYPWDSTKADLEKLVDEKRKLYQELKTKWNEKVKENAHYQDQKHRIDKDVHRTDRTTPFYSKEDLPNPDPMVNIGTNANLEILKEILCAYNVYNEDLGYVQGMSDLLSPLYATINDDALAFWAFVGFMDRTKTNFFMDQSGMHKQLLTMDELLQFMDPQLYKHLQRTDSYNLFFCFRWLLVWFKREFTWNDTLTLWEVLWTNYLSNQFHLFVALSILDQHRDFIIDYLKNFDEILKYINDLALTMDIQETLQRAEIIFYQFRQRVQTVDEKRSKQQQKVSKTASSSSSTTTTPKTSTLPPVSLLLRDLLS
ncbi:GTPase-activating protein GYP7 [Halteromyces radiatus]|uniref:GTPase-activating protein GYP7 n=1 Tax=Halteromyces radiatus TaxID=101107 RepID=UPI00221F7261|nr:GTPase-activating protein GYP7 [Halteromyces radiatus]KAI8086599.1 GTPase-activating protein GYP7 [Halteromyces radiatus]